MTTREAIGWVARQLSDELVICTTGYTCRDMQSFGDRKENFYVIGSMGLAASIGLGVALSHPRKKVVVFDGDGAILMGLGNLAMAGALKPANFIHLVFDNEAFASTGNQRTYSSQVALEAIARASGYPVVEKAATEEELAFAWGKVRDCSETAFLLIKCRPDVGAPAERVRSTPEDLTLRFREAVLC